MNRNGVGMKKRKIITAVLIALMLISAGCGGREMNNDITPSGTISEENATSTPVPATSTPTPTPMPVYNSPKFSIDTSVKYQTIESFGASGAWWSQYVGGWDEPYGTKTVATREEIATLLYSREDGIGLTSYRYNVGAGSMDSMKGDYSDIYRRAESFETEPGVYDFTKDANAQWFLNRVVELGAEEIILFCNSAPERLTRSGLAYGKSGNLSNLPAENYDEFAKYVMDVAEYMVSCGYPVKFISPINEPQWEWTGGQEGCHFEVSEIAGVYLAFLEELNSRETLAGIELSGPESGEWGGLTRRYVQVLLSNSILAEHFTTIDNHSYWTNTDTKVAYKAWMDLNYPDVKLRTSEWCEMVNGSDYTMDSAFNMFDVIYDDLTVLDVVSWQCWVAVAPGNYRDGLIYVNQSKKACRAAKRLWGYGNYTRFVRPGYTRVELDADADIEGLNASAYTGVNDDGIEELVIVMSNRGVAKTINLYGLEGLGYNNISVNVTSADYDLEETENKGFYFTDEIVIEGESIVTLVLTMEE